MIPSLDREPAVAICCWKPFSGDFRIGGNPIERIGGAVSDAGRDVVRAGGRVAKQYGAFALSFGTVGLVKPKWSGTKTASKVGQVAGIAAVAVAGGYALGPYLPTFFAPAAAPTGMTAAESSALTADFATVGAGELAAPAALTAAEAAAPAALSGLQLEAAAGSMVPEVSTFALPTAAAAGSSSLLPAAVTGAAAAAGSKLFSKAVDTVISPLFSSPAPRPEGGGGGGGGSAGGYPFQDVAISPVGNNAQFYLIAAALAALLLVAATKAQG
ncbi:MAG: hypothetical protein M0Z38_08475 [Deltaproteobacteria bacterium]|nr:hypothetical protein [Deltaproteobacteria bacterium]